MTERDNIERLFKDNYSGLYSLAFAMLKDEEAARDAVHDVFAELLTSDRHGGKGKGYLVRCVRNRCLNLLKEMTVKECVGRMVRTDLDSDVDSDVETREEYLERLRLIIATELPPQCSNIMRLRFEDGMAYQEIADTCGISKVAVYKHLRNGLDYIRKHLTKP